MPTEAKAQQMLSMDEIDAGEIEQLWLQEMVKNYDLKGKPGCEITCERVKDSNVSTIWFRNQPIAIAIRQRNDWNYTVLTLVEIPLMGGT